jgi:hypothetical protein
MNVTWATGAAYCFLRFGIEVGQKRYLYFIGGMAIFLLFLWWWDQTPQVATVVSMLPLVVALVFFYRPGRREACIFLGAVGLGIGVMLLWMGFDLPLKIFRNIVSEFHYISIKEVADIWPPIGATISEQAVPSLTEIIAKTTDSLPAFIVAGAGLAWLFYRRPKESLFIGCIVIFFRQTFHDLFGPCHSPWDRIHDIRALALASKICCAFPVSTDLDNRSCMATSKQGHGQDLLAQGAPAPYRRDGYGIKRNA